MLCVVRDGNASLMTLNQATVLMEKAPSEEDVCMYMLCVYSTVHAFMCMCVFLCV